MKKIIAFIMTVTIIAALFVGCGSQVGYNKQLIDFNYSFKYALVSHPDGEELVPIKSWTDFEGSDMVQYIDMNGIPHMTHSSRVIFKGDLPPDAK